MAATAVILAAGRGRRLCLPCKPLAVVGGVTLLERAVATARAAGLDRCVVAVDSLDGPTASFCRARLPGVEVVPVPEHDRGNGATTASALAYADARCLVMMVDHVHEPTTLRRVLDAEGELAVSVDGRPAYADVADATLVRRDGHSVVEIGKGLARSDAVETGLILCDAEPIVALARSLDGELEFNRLKHAWLESGRPITAVAVDGAFWIDVDTPSDRRAANRALVRRVGAKPADGPVARRLNRPLSGVVSCRLLATQLGPTPVTLANFVMLALSALLLALGTTATLIAGGLLLQLSSALDGVDGEIARVSGRTSPLGSVLDAVCDRYGDLLVILGATLAAGPVAAWPWALGAIVANWQLSFLRREHERIAGSLPAAHLRWQWSRDVRLLVLAVSCVVLHPLWGLIAAAVVGNLDAARRLVALIGVAQQPPPAREHEGVAVPRPAPRAARAAHPS